MSVGLELAPVGDASADTARGRTPTGRDGSPSVLKRLVREPSAMAAVTVLLVIVLACAFAAQIAPYPPLAQDLANTFAPPSRTHLLGTDALGRDVFSRLLYGGRPTLLAVAFAVAVYTLVGVTIGVAAGYLGGTFDAVVRVSVDLMLSIPGIVVLLAVIAVFDNDENLTMIVFGLLASAGLIRVVRAEAIATRNELYVAAAELSGVSRLRILVRHILPRIRGPILIQASLFAGVALAVESGLGFLGLGVPLPQPSWGNMVGEAATVISTQPGLLISAGGIIAITTLCCALLGDGLRIAFRAHRTEAVSNRAIRRVKRNRSVVADNVAPEDQELLRVRSLAISFVTQNGVVEVVHGIDLHVDSGEIVALVGESGSGKTVTARALLGLLPTNGAVTGGSIRLGGTEVQGFSDKEWEPLRGTRIALISQEPMSALDPSFTVGSQLSEILHRHGRLGRRETRQGAIRLLTTVRLRDPEDVMKRYPHQLSGGMAQRVAIALALAGEPGLLIADEPTTALDVTVQAEILDLLRGLRDSRGMSILLVTHDLGVVADLCERVVVMRSGTVVEDRPIVDLFTSPEHPYTQALIAATPSLVEMDA